MREIIFRGKAVIDFEIDQVCEFWERKVLENGNWIQGDLIWNNGIPFIVHGVIEANDEYISLEWWMPVDPETVGQYTGLKDKNGRMVFEGDIVRRTITEGWITEPVTGLIVFKNGCFTLEYEGLSKDYIHNDLIIDSKMVEYDAHSKLKEEQYSYEVIGNIHNNPELLS